MTAERIVSLIGKEHTLEAVSRTLRDFARSQRAAAVGALHVTCSDECERESCEAFQQWLAQDLLPELKPWSRSAFRTANLGARYEWGSAAIAEHHFETPPTHDGFELLIVKVDAHVCVHTSGGEVRYGSMPRYEVESTFCGALHAMLDGHPLPAVDALREVFQSEGLDRIELLNDPGQVDPSVRSLLAAVTSARLQARRAMLDIQHQAFASPTRYLILPCVTLNRAQHDTELVVGLYMAERHDAGLEATYLGLGDNPSKYVVDPSRGLLNIEDDQIDQQRPARDHRQLIADLWRQFQRPPSLSQPQRQEIASLLDRANTGDASIDSERLAGLLGSVAAASPEYLASQLFTSGACGVHHIYRAYRLARGTGSPYDAQQVLDDTLPYIDRLPQNVARQILQLLSAACA